MTHLFVKLRGNSKYNIVGCLIQLMSAGPIMIITNGRLIDTNNILEPQGPLVTSYLYKRGMDKQMSHDDNDQNKEHG